jgi:hypothetical protein
MSVTHSGASFAPVRLSAFATRHPQLAPFLVAVAIAAVTVSVALAFVGLPA